MRKSKLLLFMGCTLVVALAFGFIGDSQRKEITSLFSAEAYLSPYKSVHKGEEDIATFIARGLAEGKKPNRLIREKSPYLLQHAFNPVDWYPWEEEAFARARSEDKPIFLSIGYSTCYWCHVMEREVFDNKDIAVFMNRYFINIKVDREERPDVDRVYMAALQAMTGSGGWPISLFLTLDLKPFFAGTYFPPEGKGNIPGFKSILQRIHELWATKRKELIQAGNQVIEFLQGHSSLKPQEITLEKSILEKGFEQSKTLFDKKYGGFGNAPKFPRPAELNFLLRYYHRTKNKEALDMTLHTLKQMDKGGIHDHIGGGFHRYSTDRYWRVPHFEKMLYDQAQLAKAYLEAYQITQEQSYAETARGILDYVLRSMADPEGGFYSAEDAESVIDPAMPEKKKEGAFYVWHNGEIERVLGKDEAKVFKFYYGLKEEGNALDDPHGEFMGENILYIAHSLQETAKEFNQSPTAIKGLLEKSRKKLFSQREKRVRPHLDDKLLVSWNGMMISAYARAYQILQDKQYLAAAQKGAEFILTKLYTRDTRQLLRRYRDGDARYDAHLEDYAFFTMGLLDLYEAHRQNQWLDYAITLTETQERLFWDTKEGGFFDTTGKDKNILLKTKEDYDGAEPTGNSIAALNLLRLSQLTDNQRWREMAEKTLRLFAGRLRQYPQAMPQMLVALDVYIQSKAPTTAPLSLNTSADKVEVSTMLSVNKVHPGAQFQAAVILNIKENWHINAHIPTHEFLIGTKLELDTPEGVEILDTRYPEAERFKFSFAEDILDVYAGQASILVTLKLPENFPQGAHSLKGILHVQACNDQTCLAPSTINVEIPFEVVGFDQPIALNKSDLFPGISSSGTFAPGPTLGNEIAQLFKSEGTLLALLGIFIIGLALNLTPCVYPMIAITVSLFSAQSNNKAAGAFLKALVYVSGIATMYTGLGVLAAFTGGMFGGMLQNSWVLAGIAVLFFALAMSMFGLYELRPPYWLTSRLGGAQSVGIIGFYLSGLVVGIFAAPCIGPPIIALLALVGTRGDVLFAFWSFFILSLGLGAPYLVLGTFSGLFNKLPQSGHWLVWVKKIFGLMLMGLALYYLALAVKPSLVSFVIPTTLIGGGLYLAFMERSREGEKIFMMRWKWIAGVTAIMLGTGAIFIGQKKGIQWELYHPGRLEMASRNGQPVVLDFYADWCIPCLKMDNATFTDQKVITALKDFIKIKVDLTHPDSPGAEALVQQYQVLGVPTIIFLDRKGNEITMGRIVGYLSAREFLKRIEMLQPS